MGQRSSTETVAAIVLAFQRQATWSQAALADAVGISVPALRKRLFELAQAGIPFERDEDHPHVYWSVPKGWFPGGVVLSAGDCVELLRQLARVPRGRCRDRLLSRVLRAAPGLAPIAPSVVVPPESSESEEAFLPVAEDSVAQKVPLYMRYFTASRGTVEWRHVSVQRITAVPAARLAAICHRDGRLKWFRVNNILSAQLDPSQPYRSLGPEQVEAFLKESVDGYHQGIAPLECRFFVRQPECRWVSQNLLAGMQASAVPGGICIKACSAGLLPVARFVVGLGAAARAQSPELAVLVQELARGALLTHPGPDSAIESVCSQD